jgi:hypothetical protein
MQILILPQIIICHLQVKILSIMRFTCFRDGLFFKMLVWFCNGMITFDPDYKPVGSTSKQGVGFQLARLFNRVA